ncbi:unnamed protein product, partial [Medioppia subpectinata]
MKSRNQSIVSAKKLEKKHGFGSCIPTRWTVVILCALTNGLSYTMRTNLNLTIVAMVKRANTTHFETCLAPGQTLEQSQDEVEGDFEWTESMQGVILGAYYYGYIVTNCFGGQMADWVGARWLVGASVLSSGALTLLMPVCAKWSEYTVIIVRILTGLVQGVLTPSLYTMLAYWVPLQERGFALALVQVGGNIGAVVTAPLSSSLSQHGFAGGWPSVFYVLGIMGCLAFLPWIYQI